MLVRWSRWVGTVVVVAAAWAGMLRSGTRGSDADLEIARLIQQLGEPEFARRQEASRRIEAMGEPALASLRLAAATQRDPEIRGRSRLAVRAILKAACTSRSTGMKFVVIEPGEFQMGSARSESHRRPDESQHRVRVTRLFLLLNPSSPR